MKTKIIYTILLVGVLSLSGCSDVFNFDPYDKQQQKDFWQTQADAQAAVVACYGSLCDWQFFEPTTFALEEVASGNTAKGSTASDQPDVQKIATFQFTPGVQIFNVNWNSRYSVINVCNQAITHIPAMKIDEDVKNDLLGEARFIRAWIYFDLVRTFGEVVIYPKLPENNAYNIPKSSIADVYKFIEADLEFGFKYIHKTQWDDSMKGRVTAWAARALEAKVKMYEASGVNFTENKQPLNGVTWSDVKKITDDVIASNFYHLYDKDGKDSFFNLFRIPNENCCESILEAQCGSSKTAGGINRSAFGVYQWVRGGDFGGWGFNPPSDEMIADWAKRSDDTIRYRASVAYRGQTLPDGTVINGTEELDGTNAGKPGYKPARYNFKAYESKDDDQHLGGWMQYIEQNPRLFRYADVLLIDAEAEFNLGNIANALESVNLVRNRAYATPFTAATLTRQAIWDERRFELAFENDHFFDLVRTGQAAEVLSSRGFVYPKNCFYPLPQVQIDLSNGILKQNKYYR